MFDSRAVQKTEEAAAQVWNARGLSSLCVPFKLCCTRPARIQKNKQSLHPNGQACVVNMGET